MDSKFLSTILKMLPDSLPFFSSHIRVYGELEILKNTLRLLEKSYPD